MGFLLLSQAPSRRSRVGHGYKVHFQKNDIPRRPALVVDPPRGHAAQGGPRPLLFCGGDGCHLRPLGHCDPVVWPVAFVLGSHSARPVLCKSTERAVIVPKVTHQPPGRQPARDSRFHGYRHPGKCDPRAWGEGPRGSIERAPPAQVKPGTGSGCVAGSLGAVPGSPQRGAGCGRGPGRVTQERQIPRDPGRSWGLVCSEKGEAWLWGGVCSGGGQRAVWGSAGRMQRMLGDCGARVDGSGAPGKHSIQFFVFVFFFIFLFLFY